MFRWLYVFILTALTCAPGASMLAQPDLTARYFLLTDSLLNQGELWMARYMVYNQGGQAVPPEQTFYVRHYLSKDEQIDAGDLLLATDSIRNHHLAKLGQHGPIHSVFLLPPDADTGSYYLLMQLDSKNQVEEGTGEANNLTAYPGIRVRAVTGSGPDLTAFISDLGDNQGLIHPGDQVMARSYLNNSGSADSPDSLTFYNLYMLTPGPSWNPETAIRLGGESIPYPVILYQRHITFDETLNIPDNLKPGTYYLWLKIDDRNLVQEVDEQNNVRLFGQVEVRIPWWKQWWAKVLYVLLSAVLLYALFVFVKKRIELARELRRKKLETERMRALDRMKTQLYTNITHEFRTPLTVILGMAEELRKVLHSNGLPEASAKLDAIERNGKSLLNLINQMLDLARLEADHIQLQPVQGDVVAYIRYLFESFHSYAESKGVIMRFRPEVEQLQMDYDPKRLEQVISNLLSNAIKFTPADGYVELALSTTGAAEEGSARQPQLCITLRDTGIGISKEKLPFIFDRFYQADDSSTRSGEGTGIGLALARELVKLMDGHIEVESQPGKGSTFRVYLPIRQQAQLLDTPLPPHAEAVRPVGRAQPMPEPKPVASPQDERPMVLVVEDNADVRQYLHHCLSGKYQVEMAMNGQQGIDKAIELIPDLIVSDVMMPEKDGLELCQTLKLDERTSHIPIVLLTARAAVEDRLAGLSRGADAYLTKPFNREELLIRLDQLLKLRKRLQQRYGGAHPPQSPAQDEATRIEDTFLAKVHALVESKLDDSSFGIDQLCNALAMSRSQLHRKLKALSGRSASHYIRSIRLQKGREMLLNTDLGIAEIAYDVGFSDPNYFSRTFYKEFGINPSEVRKKA